MPRWAVVVSGHELGTEKFVPDGQQLLPDHLDERRRAAHVGLQVRREIQLPSPCTVAQLATDLSRLLDHPGVESTAMLGYSNGGAVAQQLALDDRNRCAGLVLACAFAFNMVSQREQLDGHLAPLLIRRLGIRGWRSRSSHRRPTSSAPTAPAR